MNTLIILLAKGASLFQPLHESHFKISVLIPIRLPRHLKKTNFTTQLPKPTARQQKIEHPWISTYF